MSMSAWLAKSRNGPWVWGIAILMHASAMRCAPNSPPLTSARRTFRIKYPPLLSSNSLRTDPGFVVPSSCFKRNLQRGAVSLRKIFFGVCRLCARPGDACYSRLAVNVQLFVRVERVCIVKAGSFSPPPKVDSMVVKLVPRKPQPQIDFREWDGMLRVCFMRKRRTLYSNFTTKSVLHLLEHNYNAWARATGATAAAAASDISMKVRATDAAASHNVCRTV